MRLTKLSSIFLVSMLFLGATIVHAADYKTTIKLALGSNGNILGESYLLTVPQSLEVTTNGWNKIGVVHAVKEGTADFNTSKKLVITITTSNDFKLKSGTNELGYTVATEENGSKITSFDFTAAELNTEGGTDKDIGINVTWTSSQASGTYEDYIIYTASVEDATATSNTKTVKWTASEINETNVNGNTMMKDGVTLTAETIDTDEKNINSGGTFTTASGNFTQIEITAYDVDSLSGDGWSGDGTKKTWTGDAASVSFSGNIMDSGNGTLSIVFTIEE